MKVLVCFFLLLSLALSASAKSPAKTVLTANKVWLEKRLTKIGLSQAFIREALKDYEPQPFEKVLTLNLLGFLRVPGQHMNLVTPQAVHETAKFIAENQDSFDLAKEKYKVPADVISALLWIETRHGQDVGTFHTVSVFLDLLQADLAPNRKELIKLAYVQNVKNQQGYSRKNLRQVMAERTKKKAQWAEGELIQLAAIRKEKNLDIKTLRGSYAGAFGLPQFIPSSYRMYAKSVDPETTPDLSDDGDAIVSVAYYLMKSGWRGSRVGAGTHQDNRVIALMKYNNSRDYADSILTISRRVAAEHMSAGKNSPEE